MYFNQTSIQMNTGLPFEYRTSKSSLFRSFRYSHVRNSDPQCSLISVQQHHFNCINYKPTLNFAFCIDYPLVFLTLKNKQSFIFCRDYFFLDPRVRTLSTSLRLWAKLCMIDRQAEGTLPAHAFPLLLVFFLQQGKKPILPCIHDQLKSRDQDVYERKFCLVLFDKFLRNVRI